MSGRRPPRWLEALVERRLDADINRASIVGDLAEGYAYRNDRDGEGRALRWYARQTLSLLVHGSGPRGPAPRATWGWLDRLAFALRSVVRRMLRRPATTLAVSGVLAVAIAATTAAFGVTAGTYDASHWWTDEARAIAIWPEFEFSRGQLEVLRDENRAFDAVGGILRRPAVLSVANRQTSARAVELSPELFGALRAVPQLGRGLVPEDAIAGAEPVVVLGHAVWQSTFGGDPTILERVVDVNGTRRRVVGVMPAGASQPGPWTELWLPLVMDPSDPDYWPARELALGGIAHPGLTIGEARDDVRRVFSELGQRFPAFFPPRYGSDATVLMWAERSWGDVATPLLLLLLGTGLLLVVAAIDVGNLVLARSIERRSELHVRLAIGASHGHIVRQILLESGLQVAIAMLAGGWLGALVAHRITGLFPFGTPVAVLPALDPRLLLFLAAAGGGAWLLTAGIPALHFLTTTRRATTSRFSRNAAPRTLVVAQAALSTMLLIAAALLYRTVGELERLPLGFDAEQTVAVQVAPQDAAVSVSSISALSTRVADRLSAVPGVEAAGWISAVPLLDPVLREPVNREDAQVEVAEAIRAGRFTIDEGALDALGVSIVQGRGFTPGDDPFGSPVALVNESMARALWPGADPIGRRIAVDPHAWNSWITVVGIVSDMRYEDLTMPTRPAFFLPRLQASSATTSLVVRSATLDPAAIGAAVRAAVGEVAPGVPVGDTRALAHVVRDAQGPARVLTSLLSGLALIAAVLGAVGLYASLAGWVARRRAEIGTRLALGAQPHQLAARVLATGIALTVTGFAIGAVGGALIATTIRSLLFGISPLDPIAFLLAAAVLLPIGVIAAAAPAWRAAAVPPVEALKAV